MELIGGGETELAAPQIVDFGYQQVGNGLFIFTGRVVDANPGGLTVTFGGSVPTVDGQSVTTAADGTFQLTIQLRTDGSDVGIVTASVTNRAGVESDEVMVYVSPTPP